VLVLVLVLVAVLVAVMMLSTLKRPGTIHRHLQARWTKSKERLQQARHTPR
jgi:Flp pilus assembly pilin Flp